MNAENKLLMRGLQCFLFITGGVLLFKLISQFSLDLFLAISIVVVLLILTTLRLENLKAIAVGKDGLKVDLEVIQNEIDRNKQETDQNKQELYTLISLSMGKDTYFNLQKLASGAFGKYRKQRNMGLETELYYLRNLGYVEIIKDKTSSIHEIPETGDELSDYVRVTDAGLRYINLRQSIDRKN
jgi:hypothetical protein